MKIWILRPAQDIKADDNPWEPWFDKSFGFVVRAMDEMSARQIAHENAGDENRGEFLGRETAKTKSPWLDRKYSTCEQLTQEGDAGMLMQDFASA